jgi:hypothetical protein
MTTFALITTLAIIAALAYLLGHVMGQTAVGETAIQAYKGGKITQRALDVERLMQMRRQRAEADGLSADEVDLLRDVCEALALDDQQAAAVMGPDYMTITEPVLNGFLSACGCGKLATADELRQLGVCQACYYTSLR